MASEVGICNRALQKLGAERITSLTDDSRNARSCNASYETLRDAELRAHPWSFAIKRDVLAPDTDAPAFDYTYAFSLPSDALRILPPNDSYLDWKIEGRKILTNAGSTLNLVYIARITDPNTMDITFQEALASRMAMELCEEITQSNEKIKNAANDYTRALREARRTNAIESISADTPTGTWDLARL